MHAHLSDQPLPPRPEALASCLLEPFDGGPARRLTLWPDARAAAVAGAGAVYEVEQVDATAATGQPACASLTEFSGPRGPEQVAADRRASRERIWPAVSQVPGVLGAIVLRGRSGEMAVVALAESRDALGAAVRTVMSTPLLPGEDGSLLTGPDRAGEHRLTGSGVRDLLARAATAAPAR